MKAFVSGQSGVAVFEQEGDWYLLRAQGSAEKTSFTGAVRLFDGCNDVRKLDNATVETVEAELALARAREFALQYTLTLLDDDELGELQPPILRRVEALLGDPSVRDFVANRLYARPLTPRLLERAGVLIASAGSAELSDTLHEVVRNQELIRAFHGSWPYVAERHFESVSHRDQYFLDQVNGGLVRQLVLRRAGALEAPSRSQFDFDLIRDWIQSSESALVPAYERVEVGSLRRAQMEGVDTSSARISPAFYAGARRSALGSDEVAVPLYVGSEAPASEPHPRIAQPEIVQALWRSLFAAALLKDHQGRLKACNDAFLRFSRKPEPELLGKIPSQYFEPQGRIFERYDQAARDCNCPIMTREVFGKRKRITARWPLQTAGLYGSLSVYLTPMEDRIQPTNALLLGNFPATPPDADTCVRFFETCPWAITIFDEEERVLFANRAYRLVFTPRELSDPGPGFFEGYRVELRCPQDYWRQNEKRIVHFVSGSPDAVESLVRVEHPFLANAPRDVVRFKVGIIEGKLYRGTIGLDVRYIEQLKNTMPPEAEQVEPFRVPVMDRR